MNKNDDNAIREAVKNQSKELEALLDGGLGTYFKTGFEHSFSSLMKLGYGLAIVLTLILIVCAYQFFTVSTEKQVFWGVCLLLSFNAQVATKLWIFMQTNRIMLSKELRLLLFRRDIEDDNT